MMSPTLKSLHEAGAEPLALQVAQTLARLSLPRSREAVELSAVLLMQERARGHASVDLREWAGRSLLETNDGPRLPDLESWAQTLSESGLASTERAAPLVLDENGRLYLYRYHRAECHLATMLRARAHAPPQAGAPPERVVHLFRALFPVEEHAEPDDGQALAAAGALRHRLTVITGGPGTGKTTTVVRILALMLVQNPELRVALGAPTGKAAARLAESIRSQREALPLDPDLRARIPSEVRTLHRLLGYQPQRDRFRHGPERPLSVDAVIVDEASMVDLLLMEALVAALPANARLVLVGDADQLASIDAGYVLGDVLAAAKGAAISPGFAQWCRQLRGVLPQAEPSATPWRDAVIQLGTSYRFREQPRLEELTEAVRRGESERLRGLLEAGSASDGLWQMDPGETLRPLIDRIAPALEIMTEAGDPKSLLEQQGRFRLLCALRRGRWGVETLNRDLDGWARRRGSARPAQTFRGHPILITHNDPELDLWNGDLGVLSPSFDDRSARAWFEMAGTIRDFDLRRLPPFESAWALTVHKAQGSEFEDVVLLLPPRGSRLLSRELLYTAVSRARRSIGIVASWDVLREALQRSSARPSGLAARLWG
jgi:exodeoxyribonuclease V alpha subunit